VWDALTGAELSVLKGHTGAVLGVAFGPDGRTVVSGGYDKTVRVWELPPPLPLPREMRSIKLPNAARVHHIALHPDERTLAATSSDGRVYLIDVVRGEAVGSLEGHTDWSIGLKFSPDGKWLASGGRDGTIRLWDWKAKTHRVLATGVNPGDGVWNVAFTSDGRTLVGGNTAAGWDVESGKEVVRFKVVPTSLNPIPGTDKMVFGSGGESPALLADAKTGDVVVRFPVRGQVSNVAASPDGARVAVIEPGSGAVGVWNNTVARVWDVGGGKEPVATLQGDARALYALAYSAQGDRIAGADHGGTARVWDAVTGRELHVLRGHTNQVKGVEFSRDGRTLYTSSLDGTVRVWALPPTR
jgi:WD40 repeat protein